MLIQKHSKILFQGDSITDAYRTAEWMDPRFYDNEKMGIGYPAMVSAYLQMQYPQLELRFYNRAIRGNRTCDLLERWEKDCLEIKPDILILLVGINDVWRKFDCGQPTEDAVFEDNYRKLLSSAREQNPDLQIILIEPSYLHDPDAQAKAFREELDGKIQVLQKLSTEYGAYYVPMDKILHSYAEKGTFLKWVFDDGIHLTINGHAVLAKEILQILLNSR